MDEHIVGLIRDQFQAIHDKIDTIHTDLREHTKTDSDYWKKIDQHEGQISVLKWLFGGSGVMVTTAAWIWHKLH
jgi:hypothetical protein